jgi:hypothetical protein
VTARDFHTKSSRCPNCGRQRDGAIAVNGERAPEPGDVTICMDCAHICVVADDLSLRDPIGEEFADIAGNPDLIRAQKALAAVKAGERKPPWPSSPKATS